MKKINHRGQRPKAGRSFAVELPTNVITNYEHIK